MLLIAVEKKPCSYSQPQHASPYEYAWMYRYKMEECLESMYILIVYNSLTHPSDVW